VECGSILLRCKSFLSIVPPARIRHSLGKEEIWKWYLSGHSVSRCPRQRAAKERANRCICEGRCFCMRRCSTLKCHPARECRTVLCESAFAEEHDAALRGGIACPCGPANRDCPAPVLRRQRGANQHWAQGGETSLENLRRDTACSSSLSRAPSTFTRWSSCPDRASVGYFNAR
jgi:hypothetical protein